MSVIFRRFAIAVLISCAAIAFLLLRGHRRRFKLRKLSRPPPRAGRSSTRGLLRGSRGLKSSSQRDARSPEPSAIGAHGEARGGDSGGGWGFGRQCVAGRHQQRDDLLRDRLDKQMTRFRKTQPEFFAGYQSARAIVWRGSAAGPHAGADWARKITQAAVA